MTVDEYATQFSELALYAPQMVSTKEDKSRIFYEGLHLPIRERLTTMEFTEFRKLKDAAVKLEYLMGERQSLDF